MKKALYCAKNELYHFKDGVKVLGAHDRIHGYVSNIRGDISGIRGDVTNIYGDVSSIRGDVTNISGDVSDIWDDVSFLRGDVTNINGNVSSIRGNVSSIRGDVSSIRGDVSDIEGSVTGLRGDVSFIRGYVSDIYGYVSNIRGDVSDIYGDLDECDITGEERKNGVLITDLIHSMNDKSRFDELLIKAVAPQGGTPGSSQSVVREEESQATQEKPDPFSDFLKTQGVNVVDVTPQPQATQEKCKPCQIEGNNGTCDRKDCSNSPVQESPDERQYREDVEAGVDMSTPTQESPTWDDNTDWRGLSPLWDETISLEDKNSAIRTIVAEAKRQERERILRGAKANKNSINGFIYLTDLTNIINETP